MTMARPAYAITTSSPGSELAGETAAAMAAASILFKTANPGINFNLFQNPIINVTPLPFHIIPHQKNTAFH